MKDVRSLAQDAIVAAQDAQDLGDGAKALEQRMQEKLSQGQLTREDVEDWGAAIESNWKRADAARQEFRRLVIELAQRL